jgi:hypothetical protein
MKLRSLRDRNKKQGAKCDKKKASARKMNIGKPKSK